MPKSIFFIGLLALVVVPMQVSAAVYSFTQGGYSEGAIVTISFTGSDLNSNGQISSFDAEVSDFSMSFSGNSIVPSFSLGFSDLQGLVYDLDNGPLGDGFLLDIEGVAASGAPYSYAAGPGPFNQCGVGVDCASVSDGVNQDFSQQLLVPVARTIPTLSNSSLLVLFSLIIGVAAFRLERLRKVGY